MGKGVQWCRMGQALTWGLHGRHRNMRMGTLITRRVMRRGVGCWRVICGGWIIINRRTPRIQLRFVFGSFLMLSWGQRRRLATAWRHSSRIITVVIIHGQSILAMDLEVFSQWRGMGVGLVTTPNSAVVGLVSGVNMHVLFSVAGVGKSSVATFHFTFKWFFSWKKKRMLAMWNYF